MPKNDRQPVRPIRVLHVAKVYVPDVEGGIPRVIRFLASQRKVISEIVVARQAGRGQLDLVDGVPVRRARTWRLVWSMPLAPFYPILLWMRMRRADVVDYHFPFPLVDAALALWMPRRVALVIHWHSDIVAQRRALPYLGWLFRLSLKRADRILVSNQALMENSTFLPSVADKCTLIPFGVDQTWWRKLSEAEQARIDQLRRTVPRLVLSVGRLVPYKGFQYLIDAMAQVDGHLMIVGAGHLRDRLLSRAKELDIADRVELTDHLDTDSLKCLLHACNVFVLPSIMASETFGIAQLEAMAVGRPVVNTSLPMGVPWVARDGKEALTVTPGSTDELAAAVNRVLNDTGLAARLGGNGRARVASTFTLERFTEQTLSAYAAAVCARRRKLARKRG